MKINLTHADSPYTLSFPATIANVNEQNIFIDCDTSLGTIVIQLPELSGNPSLNARIVVNDSEDNAATNHISIAGNGSESIDGNSHFVINVNGGSVALSPASGSHWGASQTGSGS